MHTQSLSLALIPPSPTPLLPHFLFTFLDAEQFSLKKLTLPLTNIFSPFTLWNLMEFVFISVNPMGDW